MMIENSSKWENNDETEEGISVFPPVKKTAFTTTSVAKPNNHQNIIKF